MSRSRFGNRQRYNPASQIIQVEAAAGITAVMKQGTNGAPHDSNIKRLGNKIRVRSGGSVALATPTAADGGAAEFDVAVSGSGPWDVAVSWLGAGLAALPSGTTTRTLTITSVGATNSPLAIPVKIVVV